MTEQSIGQLLCLVIDQDGSGSMFSRVRHAHAKQTKVNHAKQSKDNYLDYQGRLSFRRRLAT